VYEGVKRLFMSLDEIDECLNNRMGVLLVNWTPVSVVKRKNMYVCNLHISTASTVRIRSEIKFWRSLNESAMLAAR
jgi:hypothetical protein